MTDPDRDEAVVRAAISGWITMLGTNRADTSAALARILARAANVEAEVERLTERERRLVEALEEVCAAYRRRSPSACWSAQTDLEGGRPPSCFTLLSMYNPDDRCSAHRSFQHISAGGRRSA